MTMQQDEPNAPAKSHAALLIEQRAALEKQTQDMIANLLLERDTATKEHEARLVRIAADLKALGWHRTREAKAATEGAPVTEIKRSRKGKAA